MTRSRDPLVLGPNWHFDCRIETELPEDNVVGTRFLINVVFGSVALALTLFTGWLGYTNLSFRYQIHDWDRRITDNQSEVREIKRLQNEYIKEAKKVDDAYALMKAPLFISGFIAGLGQALPPKMIIDSVESSETIILVRGSIQESYGRASNLFSGYLKQLGNEAEIGPFFEKITQSDIKRVDDNKTSFEITFQRKPAPP